jgi:AraC-like DNA-binding protein
MPIDWNDAVQACRTISSHLDQIDLPLCQLPIVQVFMYQMPKGWHVNQHQHSYYELSLILSGRARDARAKKQILRPGSVFFHGPHQPHEWYSPFGKCHRLVICFNSEPSIACHLPETWPCWPQLIESAWQALVVTHQQQPGWLNLASGYLSVILAHALTLGELPQNDIHTDRESINFADRVDAFLEDNLVNPITLPDVAANAGVSLSQLTHAYQKQRGQTVGQRLISLRMEQAAYLLRETDRPLKQISEQVGIHQSAYLCRLFRKHFRLTPGMYRKRHS